MNQSTKRSDQKLNIQLKIESHVTFVINGTYNIIQTLNIMNKYHIQFIL